MVSFTSLLVAASAAIGAFAIPAHERKGGQLIERNTPNGQGTNNGFFWQFCTYFSPSLFPVASPHLHLTSYHHLHHAHNPSPPPHRTTNAHPSAPLQGTRAAAA
jgi:hypothetical protein